MVQLSRTDMTALSGPWLTLSGVMRVWSDPALLRLGLAFSIPALLILFAHEMGHYVACRFYGIPCTLPYFLPVPINFGTVGAFIRIKSQIRTKSELFDVGIAGPIAGFLVLIPFLLWGIAHSEPARLLLAAPGFDEELTPSLYVPGRCLAILLATWLFHGRLAPGMILNLHPVALAAWLGLLATSINLLPLGQLDGGHVLYAATGRLQRRLALPLWIALGLMGYLWLGWLVWCVIILVIGLYHPPVWDETIPLDPVRQKLAWIGLILLILSFMPAPLNAVYVR
ncbi:MAG TPA: site-2 protease family protein [Thermoanaerobaculia bacterium]|jgi:membrane-associated protease RseP (regulator of RpoE activity)|nr:site-2 protease family protein [Thermoanaerobaculia bacterium]